MTPLGVVVGKAYPLGLDNVDTDSIIPARWLKTVDREGLAVGAFEALRERPGNPFDDPDYAGSPILVAGCNYGCGSSREHAAWAVAGMGIRVVIASSFADIHRANLLKNGILPVALPGDQVASLLASARRGEVFTVDLERQHAQVASGRAFAFQVDPLAREGLLRGLDEIDVTLAFGAAIGEHERDVLAREPWLSDAGRRSGHAPA